MKIQDYHCLGCGETHRETSKPNKMPMTDELCTANHRYPPNVGNWRVCHAPHAKHGRHDIGSAHLCDGCWRKQFAPALAVADELAKRFGVQR